MIAEIYNKYYNYMKGIEPDVTTEMTETACLQGA